MKEILNLEHIEEDLFPKILITIKRFQKWEVSFKHLNLEGKKKIMKFK